MLNKTLWNNKSFENIKKREKEKKMKTFKQHIKEKR